MVNCRNSTDNERMLRGAVHSLLEDATRVASMINFIRKTSPIHPPPHQATWNRESPDGRGSYS